MDTAQWPQGFQEIKMVNPMEEKPMMSERKARPQKDQTLNCPRCNSTNTKFCYYNNYSLTQPRYFCKTCRRYWTEGGSLRNVPVGGGSRKNKRSSSSLSSSASSSQKLPDLNPPTISNFSSQNPNKTHEAQVQDLNLAFPAMQDYLSISQDNNHHNSSSSSCLSLSTSTPISALELLRSTGIASRGLNSFIPTTPMPDSNTLYNSGFPLQELKPNLGFPVDGLGSRYVNLHGVQESGGGGGGGGGGRLMFPFGVIKPMSSTTSEVDHQNNKGQGNSGGYWNGMLGGGSW